MNSKSLFLDDLFRVSSDNSGVQKKLVEEIFKIGRNISRNIMDRYSVKFLSNEDLEDTILDTINYIFKTYNPNKFSFHDYVYYSLNKRLTGKIINNLKGYKIKILSLDILLDDGTPLIESIPDLRDGSIQDSVSLNDAKFFMSSPKNNSTTLDKRMYKIRKMLAAGYKQREIIEKLGITLGQYHYARKLIDNQAKEAKMKMVLK